MLCLVARYLGPCADGRWEGRYGSVFCENVSLSMIIIIIVIIIIIIIIINNNNKFNTKVQKNVGRDIRKKCFLSSCYYFYSRSLVLSLFSIITVFRDLFSYTSTFISSENL